MTPPCFSIYHRMNDEYFVDFYRNDSINCYGYLDGHFWEKGKDLNKVVIGFDNALKYANEVTENVGVRVYHLHKKI